MAAFFCSKLHNADYFIVNETYKCTVFCDMTSLWSYSLSLFSSVSSLLNLEIPANLPHKSAVLVIINYAISLFLWSFWAPWGKSHGHWTGTLTDSWLSTLHWNHFHTPESSILTFSITAISNWPPSSESLILLPPHSFFFLNSN